MKYIQVVRASAIYNFAGSSSTKISTFLHLNNYNIPFCLYFYLFLYFLISMQIMNINLSLDVKKVLKFENFLLICICFMLIPPVEITRENLRDERFE